MINRMYEATVKVTCQCHPFGHTCSRRMRPSGPCSYSHFKPFELLCVLSSSSILPPAEPACSAVCDRISIRHRGGRGVCQHKPSTAVCCQWEMAALIAILFHVDPQWENLPKSNKLSFPKGLIPIRIYSKRLMTMSLTSSCSSQIGLNSVFQKFWINLLKSLYTLFCFGTLWYMHWLGFHLF